MRVSVRRSGFLLVFVGLLAVTAETGNAQQRPLPPDERGKLDGELQLLLDRAPRAKTVSSDRGAVRAPSLAAPMPSEGALRYGVIVHTDAPSALRRAGVPPNSVFDGFATARVTREQLRTLARTAAVTRVEASTRLHAHNDEAARLVGARPLNAGAVNGTPYKGQGVVACVIDTGLDYDHGDFAEADGTTRILRLWDQPDADDSTGTGHPDGFDYGAEYTTSELNGGDVPPMDVSGHGTHVTGTAASSGRALVLDGTQSELEHRGVAPKADIVMVKTTFGGAALIDAIHYCDQVGTREQKPVVVNMSLGTNKSPHDGTSTLAQAVDQYTDDGRAAGRVAVISAGNSGRPSQQIHTSGSLASGAISTEPWTVGPYSPRSGPGNDAFLTTFWIDGTNDLQVVVRSPGGAYADTLTATADTTVTAFTDTTDGAIFIESGTSADNGDRYFEVQVFDHTEDRTPAEGTWSVSVTNNGPSATTYHGWTYNQTVPGSFDHGDNGYSIASPATAASAITVGSYVHRWRWSSKNDNSYAYDGASDNRDDISTFSSRGPLRDGTPKPDLAAPGQGMVSALSQDTPNPAPSSVVPGGKHRLLRGTSTSAPVVTGAAALLLQEDASLTAAEVKTSLTDNAVVDDVVTTYGATPNPAFGAGKLNVLGAMADLLGGSTSREILSYEDPWTNADSNTETVGGGGAGKAALRFSPNTDGVVTGVLFTLGQAPAHTLSAPLNVEVWSDDGSGRPDSKLGGTVQVDTSQLKAFSPTAVNLAPASVEVTAGTDYHLVLSPSDASDEINLAYETADSASGRSQTFDGSSWSGLGGDLVVRPEVTRVGGVPTVLPVEIAGFSGVADGSSATLTWRTASETNNAGFRLRHRAPEDSSFHRVAFVEGHGTTREPRTYRQTVGDLAPGPHTFQLRQVDLDGTAHPGPTTTVTVKMKAAYDVTSVSPNPVRDHGTVSITVREKQAVQAAVYNTLGQRVAVLHDGPLPARDPTPLTVGSRLPSGLYFLRVEGELFSTTKKFVRVR